jgi:hypothetical protein
MVKNTWTSQHSPSYTHLRRTLPTFDINIIQSSHPVHRTTLHLVNNRKTTTGHDSDKHAAATAITATQSAGVEISISPRGHPLFECRDGEDSLGSKHVFVREAEWQRWIQSSPKMQRLGKNVKAPKRVCGDASSAQIIICRLAVVLYTKRVL